MQKAIYLIFLYAYSLVHFFEKILQKLKSEFPMRDAFEKCFRRRVLAMASIVYDFWQKNFSRPLQWQIKKIKVSVLKKL